MDKLKQLWTTFVTNGDMWSPVYGVAVIACSYTLYRIARILALRQRRVTKAIAVQLKKEKLRSRMENHENKEALQRVEEITSLSLQDLRTKLKNGDLKPSDCVVAYQAKAVSEDEKYNFVTEHILEAEDDAKSLEESTEKGPLYGVPVSVKDMFNVKDYESCCGFSSLIGAYWKRDCVLVQVLKKQGAIPFIKTNVPQSMFSYSCENAIHGTTVNPHDVKRSPGGSSGGEAAAVAANASVLGFGSDIGGSLRIPPAFCGVCGLKPSILRVSAKGVLPFQSGNPALRDCRGPIARDVEGLAIAMKSILVPEMFQLDPDCVPLPFRDELYNSQKPLRIGYYVDLDVFPTCPASRRAVLLAKETLENMGHELIPWEPFQLLDGMHRFFASGCFSDQGNEYVGMLKDDTISPSVRLLYYTLKLPIFVKKCLSWIAWPFSSHISRALNSLCGIGSVSDLWKYTDECRKWKYENVGRWNDQQLDAVICPSVGPALPLGYPEKIVGLTAFFAPYNLLDFTCGVLPVTKVTQPDEDGMKDLPVHNFEHYFYKQALSKDTVGLPVSVQVVTLPYQDEQCLRVMKDIESCLKDSRK